MSFSRRTFLQVSGTSAALMVAGSALVKNDFFAEEPTTKTSDISFAGSSENGTRKQMILDVLEPWREKVAEGIKGKTIFIKPNVVTNTDPLIGTHVDALRALIDFLRTISDQPIIIGESAANRGVTIGYERFGYNNLITEYKNISLIDLDDNTMTSKVYYLIWKPDLTSTISVPIHNIFVDPEFYVISICRPKTHNCMVFTGVCKNVLMGAPAVEKKQQMHGNIGWWSGMNEGENKCLAYNLFQLGNVIFSGGSVALSILDAWEGMEGNGPANGTSIMHYCSVAGTDPLAVDRLCIKLMGFSDTPTDPMNNATPSFTDARALLWLSNAGMGNFDLNKINFIKGSLDEVKKYIQPYKLPDLYTGDPSYETNWTGGPPDTVFTEPVNSIRYSQFLDPKPFLFPQVENIKGSHHIKISFSLPVGYMISINIFDLQGVKLRSLGNKYLNAGKYSIEWNCQNSNGQRVQSGCYVVRLGFDGRFVSNQITLI